MLLRILTCVLVLSIDKKEDPTIQLMYQVSKEKFENECQVEEEKLEVIKDLCSKARRQFQKILTCLDKGESTEKIEKYGRIFLQTRRKFTGKDRDVTPIGDTPDISNLSTPPSNNDTATKDDLDYIENYKVNNNGRMKWEKCYNEGQKEGFFSTYASFHIQSIITTIFKCISLLLDSFSCMSIKKSLNQWPTYCLV